MLRPIFHGVNKIQESNRVIVKIPTDRLNVEALYKTLEANEDKGVPVHWLKNYETIAPLYKILLTEGWLSDEVRMNTEYELLEMAFDDFNCEIEEYLKKPAVQHQRNYYYEFVRSLAVEKDISTLKEHLDDECDFI